MRLLQGNSINEELWDKFAQSDEVFGRSIYQTRAYYNFLRKQYSMKTFAFALEDEGNILALMVVCIQFEGGGIRRMMSRRAIVHGGPMIHKSMLNKQTWLAEFFKSVVMKLKSETIYLEIRNYHDYSVFEKSFDFAGFQYNPHLNVVVDTTTPIDNLLSENRKRDIKQAKRNGVEIVENPTVSQVKEWYDILRHLYRDKVKTPLMTWSFFENIINEPWSDYLLVKHEGKIIGGILAVYQEGNGYYEWYVCGQDKQYPLLHPSTMATYAAILKAQSKGCYFDFMGAGKPNQPYGVRDYKLRFGGKQVEYGRYLTVEQNLLYNIGCLGVKLLKKHARQ